MSQEEQRSAAMKKVSSMIVNPAKRTLLLPSEWAATGLSSAAIRSLRAKAKDEQSSAVQTDLVPITLSPAGLHAAGGRDIVAPASLGAHLLDSSSSACRYDGTGPVFS